MIRIGIVGCGRILAAHLRGYRLLRGAGVDDFCITALCSRKADDARGYVSRDQGPAQRAAVSDIPGDPLAVGEQYLSDFQPEVDVQVYTDYRQMIAEAPIDAVNDFTTHALHHQVADAAFAQGKDLLTQKPLAVTMAAARQMCEMAEAKGRVLGVFENARNGADTRHKHWLFESGLCGKLQMIFLGSVGAWWAPDRIVAETPWRHRLDEAGGITIDLGVHQAHVIRYLAGEIQSIDARTSIVEPVRVTKDAEGNVVDRIDCDADDTVMASFETERGVVGNLFASWGGHGEKTVVGEGGVFYGSRGRVSGNEVTLDGPQQHQLTALYDQQADPERKAADFPLGVTDGFALNQYDWLEAVRHRREPETSGHEGLRDLAVAFAMLESHHAGRRVEIAEVLDGSLREYQKPIDEKFGF